MKGVNKFSKKRNYIYENHEDNNPAHKTFGFAAQIRITFLQLAKEFLWIDFRRQVTLSGITGNEIIVQAR